MYALAKLLFWLLKPIVFHTFSLPWRHGILKFLLSESSSADLLLPMLYVIVFFSLTMTHCQCHFHFWSSENQREWVCLYESKGPWQRNDIDHFKEIVMKHIHNYAYYDFSVQFSCCLPKNRVSISGTNPSHQRIVKSKFRGQFDTILSSVIYKCSCCFQTPKQ